MTYRFSHASLANLEGVNPDLKLLCREMLKYHDFKVIDGLRTLQEQQKLVEKGFSKTLNSKHLRGLAVDLLPYVGGEAIGWDHTSGFMLFAGRFLQLSTMLHKEGIISRPVRWGGDWDMDLDVRDNRFNDLVHFELMNINS